MCNAYDIIFRVDNAVCIDRTQVSHAANVVNDVAVMARLDGIFEAFYLVVNNAVFLNDSGTSSLYNSIVNQLCAYHLKLTNAAIPVQAQQVFRRFDVGEVDHAAMVNRVAPDVVACRLHVTVVHQIETGI